MSRLKTSKGGASASSSAYDKNKRRKKKATPRRSGTPGSSAASSSSASAGPSSSSSSSAGSSTLASTSSSSSSSGASMKNSAAAPSPTSASGTPTAARECEQCGNQSALEVGANAKAVANCKKVTAPSGCQVCDYVGVRKAQRHCIHCERAQCEFFCEWCGNGYHAKCAKACGERVHAADGFCCRKCEAEQADDDDASGVGADADANARCGECELPFNSTAHDGGGGHASADAVTDAAADAEPDAEPDATGFQVNQSVLVENDEVLYNAVITDVDAKQERIKIHFLRWSKSFDNWYAMDDERINESLACDCCNRWFHIGCLPPIKSAGRFKDTTYVCPTCLDDAKAFYGGTRGSSSNSSKTGKTASASATTSTAATSARARKASIADDAPVASSSKKRPSRTSSAPSDSDSDGDTSARVNSSSSNHNHAKKDAVAPVATAKKRKRANSADSASSAEEKKARAPVKRRDEPSGAGSGSSAHSKAKTTATATATAMSKKRDRAESLEDDAATTEETHSSPEHATTGAAAATGDASDARDVISTGATATSTATLASASVSASRASEDMTMAPPAIRRKISAGHSVSALLNSPSSPERGAPQPATTTSASSPLVSQALFVSPPVLVKIEKDPLSLPAPVTKKASGSTRAKVWVTGRDPKPTKAQAAAAAKAAAAAASAASASASSSSSSARNSLSAFDILREVAAQSMSDDLEGVPTASAPSPPPPPTRKPQKSRAKVKAEKADKAEQLSRAATVKNEAGDKANAHAPVSGPGIAMNSFVDLHFAIRKEMYLRICQLEDERQLECDTAQTLRALIYPTSDKFQDLKFVYVVNKDLPSAQLTKRLLELVPITAGGSAPVIPVLPIPLRPSLGTSAALSLVNGSSCSSSAAPSPVCRRSTPSPVQQQDVASAFASSLAPPPPPPASSTFHAASAVAPAATTTATTTSDAQTERVPEPVAEPEPEVETVACASSREHPTTSTSTTATMTPMPTVMTTVKRVALTPSAYIQSLSASLLPLPLRPAHAASSSASTSTSTSTASAITSTATSAPSPSTSASLLGNPISASISSN